MTTLCSIAACGRPAVEGKGYCSRHAHKEDAHPFKASYSLAGDAHKAEQRKRGRGEDIALQGSAPPLRKPDGREVCPLYAHEPVWFGHRLTCEQEPGEIVERCACGFVRRLTWGRVEEGAA